MHTLFQLIESYNFKDPIDANGFFTIKNEQTNTNQRFQTSVDPAGPNLRKSYIPFFGEDINVGNIQFTAFTENGERTQGLTTTSGYSALKVFSTVAHTAVKVILEGEYKALLAVAKKREMVKNTPEELKRIEKEYGKRVRLYAHMVEVIVAKLKPNIVWRIIKAHQDTNQTVYVVYTGSENIERGMQKIASRVT